MAAETPLVGWDFWKDGTLLHTKTEGKRAVDKEDDGEARFSSWATGARVPSSANYENLVLRRWKNSAWITEVSLWKPLPESFSMATWATEEPFPATRQECTEC